MIKLKFPGCDENREYKDVKVQCDDNEFNIYINGSQVFSLDLDGYYVLNYNIHYSASAGKFDLEKV